MFMTAGLIVCLRWTMTVLLAATAIFVASRRLAGALETPLGRPQLLVAGLLLAGLAQTVHAPIRRGQFRAGDAVLSLAVFALAASLSLPGSDTAAILGFWAVIVGEELWAWRGMLPARFGAAWAKRKQIPPNLLPAAPCSAVAPAGGDLDEEREPMKPAADVLQQLTLRTTAEGGQQLSGWLRIRLTAGQRTGNLHVAFCPPFDRMPQVEAEAVSGPDCRIKAAQVLPYGARLDVKLDEPAGKNESLLVWFFARSEE